MKKLLIAVAALALTAGVASAQQLVLGTGSFSGAQSQGGAEVSGTNGNLAIGPSLALGGSTAQASSNNTSLGSNFGAATLGGSVDVSFSTTNTTAQGSETSGNGCLGLCLSASGASFGAGGQGQAYGEGFAGFGFTAP